MLLQDESNYKISAFFNLTADREEQKKTLKNIKADRRKFLARISTRIKILFTIRYARLKVAETDRNIVGQYVYSSFFIVTRKLFFYLLLDQNEISRTVSNK